MYDKDNEITAGEDIADTIVLWCIVAMLLICLWS
jgi:hypothetical protein